MASYPSPVRIVVIADNEGRLLHNVDGIDTDDIMAWLTMSDSSMIGWDIDSVINIWLSGLSREKRLSIFSSVKTHYKDSYYITYVPRKFLQIQRLRRVWRLFDLSGYFKDNESLQSACTAWSISGDFTPPTRDGMVREWRGFKLSDIQEWCINMVLSIDALTDAMVPAMESAKIKTPMLYGLGSIGSRFLRESGKKYVARYSPDRQPTVSDNELLPVFLSAYYGGRQEAVRVGTWSDQESKNIYRYDMRSAYPWALSWCGAIGFEWNQADEFTDDIADRMSLWYVVWDVGETTPLGPLPYRHRSGRIRYPTTGRGWYWWPEVRSAIAAYGQASVRILRGYVSPRSGLRPWLPMVKERYEQRRELEAAGNPVAELVKGGLQAAYGQLLTRLSSEGQPGRWYNPALAGWVTSAVRARLIDAWAGREQTVCNISTDGILSTGPLRVKRSDGLGSWRRESWRAASLILPGVYRLQADDRVEVATMGVAGGIDFDDLLGAITEHERMSIETRWFSPNILSDYFEHLPQWQRCRWLDGTTSINPWTISHKRTGIDRSIGLDWRNDSIVTRPYRSPGLPGDPERDSAPYRLPPAWEDGGVDLAYEATRAILHD